MSNCSDQLTIVEKNQLEIIVIRGTKIQGSNEYSRQSSGKQCIVMACMAIVHLSTIESNEVVVDNILNYRDALHLISKRTRENNDSEYLMI